MENKDLIIIALIVALIYLYYQQRKQTNLATFTGSTNSQEIQEVKKVNKIFADFCKNEIGGQDINEIRTKLNGRTLAEILEENEDYETSLDELKRTKGELEAEIIMLTNSRKNQVSEKERIITRLKEEQTELEKKIKKKAKLLDEEQTENNKLTEKITSLETKITELAQERSDLLDQINKHDDLDAFSTWLNENEERKANLPDWEKVIQEVKDKVHDYHLQKSSWSAGWLKNNREYWQIFKNWLEKND